MKYLLLTLSILACLYTNAQKTLYRYYTKDGWGVSDEKLNIVIIPQYDKIQLSQYPYIYVYKDGKCGLTDTKGKLIVPCEYEDGLKIVSPAMAAVKATDGYKVMSLPSGKLSPSFARIKGNYYGKEPLIIVKNEQNKMAVYNAQTNKLQLDFQYEDADFLKTLTVPLLKIYKQNVGYGLVNGLSGKEILPIRFSGIELWWDKNTPVIKAITTDKHTEYYDPNGKTYAVKDAGELRKIQGKEEGEYESAGVGYFDKTLKFENTGADTWQIWQAAFPEKKIAVSGISSFTSLGSSMCLVAKQNGKAGLIDENGKFVLPAAYDEITKLKMIVPREFSSAYYTIKQGGLSGLVDAKTLKVIKQPIFSDICLTWEIVGMAEELKGVNEGKKGAGEGKKAVNYNLTDLTIEMAQVEMPDGKKGFMNLSTGKVYIPGVE